MGKLRILSGFLFLVFSNYSIAVDCEERCQLEQVTAYFAALDKVAKKGSTVDDIEALLSLTHDEVEYIHVEYQANFNKEAWREAFVRNLELGRYQNTEKNQIRILNSISGKNHIAIEYSHGIIQPNGAWQKTDSYLAVFGFIDGKLSLIKELW